MPEIRYRNGTRPAHTQALGTRPHTAHDATGFARGDLLITSNTCTFAELSTTRSATRQARCVCPQARPCGHAAPLLALVDRRRLPALLAERRTVQHVLQLTNCRLKVDINGQLPYLVGAAGTCQGNRSCWNAAAALWGDQSTSGVATAEAGRGFHTSRLHPAGDRRRRPVAPDLQSSVRGRALQGPRAEAGRGESSISLRAWSVRCDSSAVARRS